MTVSTDPVSTAEAPPSIAAEVGAQAGRNLVENIVSLLHLENAMIDLTDLDVDTDRRHGRQLGKAKRKFFDPMTGAILVAPLHFLLLD